MIMLLRHIDRCLWRHGRFKRKTALFFSTYNPTDRKYPPDIMEKFLERLSKYGQGQVLLGKDNSSGVAVVTIENHKRRNALTGHMMAALKEVVNELEAWEQGKAVVLRGHGDTFCSGADLTAVVREIGTLEEGRMMCEYMQETLTRFMELPLISVAALNGKALGGGAELATACDFRLMNQNAGIGFVQSKLGLSTGWGGGSRLVKMIGKRKALELLATATILSYSAASKCGLVDGQLQSDVDSSESCIDWLRNGRFLHADAKVVQTMKKISVNADDMSLRDALDEERDLFANHWGSAAHLEALNKNIKHR